MTNVAAIIIQKESGEFLLLDRAYPPFGYALSGGAIEDNETALTTVIRETVEEIGVVLDPNKLKYIRHIITPDRKFNICLFYAKVKNNIEITINEEHYDYKWVYKEKIHELKLAENTALFFQDVKALV